MSVMTDIPTLSASEKKDLSRFKRAMEMVYVNYISVGLALGGAALALTVALITGRNFGYIMALICGGVAVNIFFVSRSLQKLFRIVNKMNDYINQLEERQNRAR